MWSSSFWCDVCFFFFFCVCLVFQNKKKTKPVLIFLTCFWQFSPLQSGLRFVQCHIGNFSLCLFVSILYPGAYYFNIRAIVREIRKPFSLLESRENHAADTWFFCIHRDDLFLMHQLEPPRPSSGNLHRNACKLHSNIALNNFLTACFPLAE